MGGNWISLAIIPGQVRRTRKINPMLCLARGGVTGVGVNCSAHWSSTMSVSKVDKELSCAKWLPFVDTTPELAAGSTLSTYSSGKWGSGSRHGMIDSFTSAVD